jgi:pilus assembly protein FimV
VEPPKAETKGAPPVEPPKDATKAEPPKGEQAPPPAAQPTPKPKVVAPPPPPPEQSLLDQILSDPLYIAAGGAVLILLGGIGYMLIRRRSAAARDDEQIEKQAPKLGKTAATATPAMAAAPAVAAPAVSDDVDPLAEADLYLNFGRDAQAEEVLKEALEKNPRHEEVQLKLLQIYATRKDKAAFEKTATTLNGQTGGVGENWLKAAALGYSFDPENPLYAAGKSAPAVLAPAAGAAAATDLDFDLELAPTAGVATTDFELEAGKTHILQPGELAGAAADGGIQDITADSGTGKEDAAGTGEPDFMLNAHGPGKSVAEPDITLDAPIEGAPTAHTVDVTGDVGSPMLSAIDFNFEETQQAPTATAPEGIKAFTHDGTVILPPEEKTKKVDLDFDMGAATVDAAHAAPAAPDTNVTATATNVSPDLKLDFGKTPVAPDFKLDDINLALGEPATTAEAPQADAGGGAKDDHWYDVQTKFDLAKAYQEMGDKDGAREILQEVIKEGDPGQQAEAKQLLEALG